ncbi:MAG: hypothetical protein WD558_08800, partial [Pseudomonadales bacterium]
MHTSFLSHARGVYFWLSVIFCTGCIIAYAIHDPKPEPNGGTMLGYTLGTLGAVLILWLLYLGRRKRNFIHGWGTVRGWVSAHVYFGVSLLLVATLHSGFQFGINIHTLAYGLMCLVIFSGIFGVWAYRTFPEARNDIKKSQSLDEIFSELEEIDANLERMLGSVEEDIRSVVISAIDRTVVGGNLIDQLTARDNSRVIIDGHVHSNKDQARLINWLVKRLSGAGGQESTYLTSVTQECGVRRNLLRTIRT